jgi:hypothetical protein
MKNEITYTQAQRIIDIACDSWKSRLADIWGKAIALKSPVINVQSEFIKEMKQAANAEQFRLLDEIFGKEESKYKVGDWVIVKNYHPKYDGMALKIKEFKGSYVYWEDTEYCSSNFGIGDIVRLATESEIKKATCLPDGTPILIKTMGGSWGLRYADGNGGYYDNGSKRGRSNSGEGEKIIKLDANALNNLPVNE